MICKECQFEKGHSLKCSHYILELPPMGVSQWRKHGQDFGYWEYFKKETKDEFFENLIIVVACNSVLSVEETKKFIKLLKQYANTNKTKNRTKRLYA